MKLRFLVTFLLALVITGCGDVVYHGPLLDGKSKQSLSITQAVSKLSQENSLLMHEIQTLRQALLDERLTKRCPR